MNNFWPLVPLGEVLKPVSRPEVVDTEKTYKILGAHWYAEGLYVKDTLPGSQIRADKVFRVDEGDFVYNRLFAWKGSFAVATEENAGCYVSNEFPCFTIDQDRAAETFLWRYFSRASAWEEALGLSTGGTPTSRNRLKEEKFLAMQIPLPPLSEQRRIVVRIEELAVKINEAWTLRQQAAEEAEVLLASAMRSHFDFTAVDQQVRDYASVLGGYAFPSDLYAENGSHQIIRIGNVRDGHLDLSRSPVRWDLQDDNRIQRYELKEGDILISMTGTRNKRDYGYVAIVPPGVKLLLNQRVGKVIPRTDLDKQYLAYFLRSPFFRDNLFPRATGTANQANIGNKDIEDVPFDPPTSVAEQRRIVAELDSLRAQVEALKKLQTATATELDALLPSILDKAFKGDL